ncbi:(2Fe-2S)-binding protein [Rhodococcus coprophilus]|uniref:Uncharacterized Fe-S protein n=1 Tax=Rhodococcus coprophilus TaxID=38310 RepID=A0A2X4XAB6_9NOCA|nr:(2Fe-2S)-binding protein [Rhodococcus coprophilus]MBM7459579.1 iron complex transport system ATP-binding protein [Rhodococcus coprophilus]SQI36705.1 Uncharacterized Fe-S protein [Rhodococcus coprophilus]
MTDAAGVLERIASLSPFFAVGTGPVPDGRWQPTTTLRDPLTRDALIAATAERMGITEARVAASTLHLGYAARLWSVAVGSVAVSGRCIGLEPERLLWKTEGGTLLLHLPDPQFGASPSAEVLDGQIEPLITAWGSVLAPGAMWGNTASALTGVVQVVGDPAIPHVEALLAEPRLRAALDPSTRRRRSCCLFYRTPGGGVCGDCPFPSPPADAPRHRR